MAARPWDLMTGVGVRETETGWIKNQPLRVITGGAVEVEQTLPRTPAYIQVDPFTSIRSSEYLALLRLAAKCRLLALPELQEENDAVLRAWGER